MKINNLVRITVSESCCHNMKKGNFWVKIARISDGGIFGQYALKEDGKYIDGGFFGWTYILQVKVLTDSQDMV